MSARGSTGSGGAAAGRRLRALHDHVRSQPDGAGGAAPNAVHNESDSGAVRQALRVFLPIPVGVTGIPEPAALAAIRQSMHEAAARGKYRVAAGLSDILFVAEPQPVLSLEDCVGGETAEEKAAFFAKHGCIVVPHCFEGEHLARLQKVWSVAVESARAQWEDAKLEGVVPSPMDGIYFKNQAELNNRFPGLGSAGFGRRQNTRDLFMSCDPFCVINSCRLRHVVGRSFRWFDIPRDDFYAEALRPEGDSVLLDLIDPYKDPQIQRVASFQDICCILEHAN